MKYRHLVTKTFDWGLISKSLILDDYLVLTKLQKRYGDIARDDYSDLSISSYSDVISIGLDLSSVKTAVENNTKLSKLLLTENEDLDNLCNIFKKDSANIILNDNRLDSQLRKLAVDMFSDINPLTHEPDVSKYEFFTKFIPLVVVSGAFPPQVDDQCKYYYNPYGVVTVAEFLDSLNAIKSGSNSKTNRKKSLDNISDEKDFFNEGYQSCVRKLTSPFYNLYTRAELLQPITRLELAYITVICWDEFYNKYGGVFSGDYLLGINFDWNSPHEVLVDFEDGHKYKIYKKICDDTISINLRDYISSGSVTKLKADIKEGIIPIPLPMFMSLLELGVLDLFYFEDSCLDPLKEVSRGDLAYFLSKLAFLFGGDS